MDLKNLMEIAVEEKLAQLIETINCCQCQQCRTEVAAYALNRLPPKYVSTQRGEWLTELDLLHNQQETDIIRHILQGIEVIAKNPHH